jgi:hypothetical protein
MFGQVSPWMASLLLAACVVENSGPAGPAGATGAEGPMGPTGATGLEGPKGDPGDSGSSTPAFMQLVERVDEVERLALGAVGAHGVSLSLSNGALVVGCGDADCSSTRRAFVRFPESAFSATLVPLEANQTLSGLGATGGSDLGSMTFGTDSNQPWNHARPFYLYAVQLSDTEIGFALSAQPNRVDTGNENNIALPRQAAPVQSQRNVVLFEAPTVAVTSSPFPMIRIGSVLMRRATATVDWEIMPDAASGLGRYQEGRVFQAQAGTFGAVPGGFAYIDGCTTDLQFTTNVMNYTLSEDGSVRVFLDLENDGGTEDEGCTGLLRLVLPYATAPQPIVGPNQPYAKILQCVLTNNAMAVDDLCYLTGGGASSFSNVALRSVGGVHGGNFPNGNRALRGQFEYMAFPALD